SQGGLFLVAEGNEVRLQVSSQGLQGAARAGDETVELRQGQELTDEADAAGAALLKDHESSGKDAAEHLLAGGGAEERVNGVGIGRAVMARPVVEGGVRDAEPLGSFTLGARVEIGEVIKGGGDLGAGPTERFL